MSGVSICTPEELGPDECARWREFQHGDRRLSSPFLGPEFATVMGRHCPDVRVAVLHDGPDVVGFFPYHRKRWGIGRALAYGLANAQGIVTAPGLQFDPRELFSRCGLAAWEFDNLLAHQAGAFMPRRVTEEPAPFIDLSTDYEAWLRSKRAAGSAVKPALRKHRKLAREVGEVTFDFDVTRREVIDLLIRWKSQQYRRTGWADIFSRPWVRAVVEELTHLRTADFAGTVSVLTVAGQPAAIQQSLRANGVLACWFPAYDTALAPYSPGVACMLELVRAAARHGLTEIDLAKGDAEYKQMLKDGDRRVTCGWAERPSPVALVRRLQQDPRRRLTEFVLARPPLRRAARRTLRQVGRARAALSRTQQN